MGFLPLQVLPKDVQLLGDGEAPVREPLVPVLQYRQEDRVLRRTLPAVHEHPFDVLPLPVGNRGEVRAEPLREVGFPRADAARKEGVLRQIGLQERVVHVLESLYLLLPMGHLLRDVVVGQLAYVLEDGRAPWPWHFIAIAWVLIKKVAPRHGEGTRTTSRESFLRVTPDGWV